MSGGWSIFSTGDVPPACIRPARVAGNALFAHVVSKTDDRLLVPKWPSCPRLQILRTASIVNHRRNRVRQLSNAMIKSTCFLLCRGRRNISRTVFRIEKSMEVFVWILVLSYLADQYCRPLSSSNPFVGVLNLEEIFFSGGHISRQTSLVVLDQKHSIN